MRLNIVTEDPLDILRSTKRVLEAAEFVFIRDERIPQLSKRLSSEISRTFQTLEYDFASSGSRERDVNLLFFQNVVNFCFWPDLDQPKWEVEWPQGVVVSGGWYGLVACFRRALDEGAPIDNPEYLALMSEDEARMFFRSSNGAEIPLLSERLSNFREAGAVLEKKYRKTFMNVVEASGFDAIKLTELITADFPSFRDVSVLEGEEVFFLKRAQIVANDLTYRLGESLKRREVLTAFADYRIPQILRHFGVLEYEPGLAERIDSQTLIPKDSREEVEIRAATIWAVELIRQCIPGSTTAAIDNTLWLLAQKESGMKPYHRTRTIFY